MLPESIIQNLQSVQLRFSNDDGLQSKRKEEAVEVSFGDRIQPQRSPINGF